MGVKPIDDYLGGANAHVASAAMDGKKSLHKLCAKS